MTKTSLVLIASLATAQAQDALLGNLPKDFIDPYIFITGAAMASSADVGSLGTHGHDPNNNFAIQGIDSALSLKPSKYFKGFANINAFTNEESELEAEWEEGYLKALELPGGFEIRGGRYYNDYGLQNNVHLHGWDYVDSNLITTRFLGDEGTLTELGGEVSWKLPVRFSSVITASFGDVFAEAHEEEGDEEEEDELEGESALFSRVFTIRSANRFLADPYNKHQVGLSYAFGENRFGGGKDTQVFGVDYVYQWRQNGDDKGGQSFTLESEVVYRDVDYRSEDGSESGNANEFGAYLSGIYGLNDDWFFGARYDYVQGLGSQFHESEQRNRYSLAATRKIFFSDQVEAHARLQYNLDDIANEDLEHSVLLQIQLGLL